MPKDAYYAEAVAWAYEKGIVNGSGNDIFGPLRPAARQEMSKIFFGFLSTLDVSMPEEAGFTEQYTDQEEIASWACEAVEQMTAIGLLAGEDDGSFNPNAGANRAQAAAVLIRLADFISSQNTAVSVSDETIGNM